MSKRKGNFSSAFEKPTFPKKGVYSQKVSPQSSKTVFMNQVKRVDSLSCFFPAFLCFEYRLRHDSPESSWGLPAFYLVHFTLSFTGPVFFLPRLYWEDKKSLEKFPHFFANLLQIFNERHIRTLFFILYEALSEIILLPFMNHALQTRSDLCIPRHETARPRSNFHIHVSVSNLYIPTIGPPILPHNSKSLTDTRM